MDYQVFLKNGENPKGGRLQIKKRQSSYISLFLYLVASTYGIFLYLCERNANRYF